MTRRQRQPSGPALLIVHRLTSSPRRSVTSRSTAPEDSRALHRELRGNLALLKALDLRD